MHSREWHFKAKSKHLFAIEFFKLGISIICMSGSGLLGLYFVSLNWEAIDKIREKSAPKWHGCMSESGWIWISIVAKEKEKKKKHLHRRASRAKQLNGWKWLGYSGIIRFAGTLIGAQVYSCVIYFRLLSFLKKKKKKRVRGNLKKKRSYDIDVHFYTNLTTPRKKKENYKKK